MLLLELRVTIAAFALGIGTLIVGVFGMNLHSGLEQNEKAFYLTATITVVLCIAIFQVLIRNTNARKILAKQTLRRRSFI
jgi:magnesium transporter